MRHWGAGRSWVVVGALTFAVSGCAATESSEQVTPTTSAIPNPQVEIDILYSSSSPPFAIVQEETEPRMGAASVTLLMTQDFVHFKDITPPVSLLAENGASKATIGGFGGASFPTPDDGWVVVANADYSSGYLLHTLDGGSTWRLVMSTALWSGSGGGGRVTFVDPTYGWLAAGNPSSNSGGETLSRTTDGGNTWQTVFSESQFNQVLNLQMPTFVSPTIGFVGFSTAVFAPSSTVPAPTEVTGALKETTDGGETWSDVSVPIASTGDWIFTTPSFFGSDGVEPILVMKGSQAKPAGQSGHIVLPPPLHGPVTVDFDTTSDGGTTWTPTSALGTPVVGQASPASGFTDLPAVSVADASDWWILSVAPSGRLILDLTADGGNRWTSPADRGLPTVPSAADQRGGVTEPIAIAAVTGEIALAEIYTNPATTMTPYLTLDGGMQWERLTSLG